ncbi:MAG: hypothetical protein IKN26_08410 [Eubacterium sp.]|nr:hypothetical protein [Eubacterium sp.]
MEFCVDFAKLNIKINSKYDYTYNFCREFETKGKIDFEVETTDEKIDKEIENSEFNPPRDYAESICIYREIAEVLPSYNRCVFHGAVIEYNNKGFIFTAPSGTGKTTHISLWKKFLGDKMSIVNGDKPILHFENGEVFAYSTPYAGKERLQNHSSVKLSGICLIKRGKENKIQKVNAGDYLTEIVPQVYMPFEPLQAMKTLEHLDELLKDVPMYVLYCDISKEAFKTSFEELTGEKYED